MIYEQLSVLDPLATSLRKPAAQRLISNGSLLLMELTCYLLVAGSIAVMVFLNNIYPFYVLSDILYKARMHNEIGIADASYLNAIFYALFSLIGLLFILLSRTVRKIRLKNQILNLAGKDMKLIAAQYLKRKAAIDAIDQRHFSELPLKEDGTYITSKHQPKVNEVPNPGFEEESLL